MILSIVASLIANALSKQLERAKFKCVLKRLRIQLNFLTNIPIIPNEQQLVQMRICTQWY